MSTEIISFESVLSTINEHGFGIVHLSTFTTIGGLHFRITVGEKGNTGLLVGREGNINGFGDAMMDIIDEIRKHTILRR